jgi:cellulose synthase/poly-beta-1,6-N-acetylglucosamine synthase-like glycosyltransferase
MASRLLAGGLLLASGLIAWLAITSALAARLLQAIIGISVVYVGYLAFRGWQLIRKAVSASTAPAEQTDASLPTPLPLVSVIVPARNEAGVIADVIGDLVRQRYGPATTPRFEVLVVDDDSTDGTGAAATRAAQAAGAPDGLVRVLPRAVTKGTRTKGAALEAASEHARGEIVAAVDADTRVGPDFLRQIVQAWQRDATAAAIQARREPTNAGHSWLTSAQGEEQIMDLASQCGRRQAEGTAELRGNGMFVRRETLDRVGGWNPAAITEDLELSTRLAAAGEHVALAPEVAVGEEAVETLGALWWQRTRWAEGSLRRLMEHGPKLLAGSAPLGLKLDFLAFTGEFLIPPLFAASVVASLITVALPVRADWTVPVSLFLGYGLGSFLLAIAGLAGLGVRGAPLLGRSIRGALFLSHWLVVVPVVLAWITVGPVTTTFRKTPRAGRTTPAT